MEIAGPQTTATRTVTSKVTTTSQQMNPEYRLLSQEMNQFQQNLQQILAFCSSEETRPAATGPARVLFSSMTVNNTWN
jgi:hypothetical protein